MINSENEIVISGRAAIGFTACVIAVFFALGFLVVSNSGAQPLVQTHYYYCYEERDGKVIADSDLKSLYLTVDAKAANLQFNMKSGEEHNFSMRQIKHDVLTVMNEKTHAVLYGTPKDNARWVMGTTENKELYLGGFLVKDDEGQFTYKIDFACVFTDIVKRAL